MNTVKQVAVTDKIVDEIAVERGRQITEENFLPEGDDKCSRNGELARAAACYTVSAVPGQLKVGEPEGWPWPPGWWKPQGARRNLIKAAALIVAEIERLDRLQK